MAWTIVLNDRPVEGISSFLTQKEAIQGKPYRLVANVDKSFIGSYVLGMGFVMEPEEAQALNPERSAQSRRAVSLSQRRRFELPS